MKRLQTLVGLLAAGFVLSCTATVTAQFVGAGILWSRGMLEPAKLVRYAGVLYGLDPLELTPGENTASDQPAEPLKREELLADRVQKTASITDRQTAIRKGTDDIRSVVLGLRNKRERQETSGKVFESYLQQLETDNTTNALREIQITLEALPPKLAKNIIYGMLTETSSDLGDDVMADIVSVIKSMPADKIRKIVGEFKTDDERKMLHDMLVEIGDLHDRGAKLTGTQP